MANEKWLIDANEALRMIENSRTDNPYFNGKTTPVWEKAHDCAISCVMACSTVDAVEVVHGEWEITEDDYFDLVELKCSVCGESYGFEDYEDDTPKNYHYCPNCGAKMDGDGNDI